MGGRREGLHVIHDQVTSLSPDRRRNKTKLKKCLAHGYTPSYFFKIKKKIETLKSTNSFFKEKKKEKMIIGNTPYCRLIYNKYPCVKLAFFSFIFLTTRIEADKNKQYLLICTVMMTKLNNARKKCSELSD